MSSTRDKPREARYKQRFQRDQRKIRELQETLETALAENEKLSGAAEERDQLVGMINQGAARVAFDEACEAAGVDPEYVDDLWALAPIEAGEDGAVDPKKVKAHVAEAVKGRKVFLRADDDDDQEDDDDSDAPPSKADKKGRVSALDLAKPAKGKAKPQTDLDDDDQGDDEDDEPAPPPKRGKAQEKPQAPALGKGLGGGRGTRDTQRRETVDDVVDRDFAETGRTDAFRI